MRLVIIKIKTIMDSYNSPSTKPLYRATQVVWFFVSIIEIILAFRFILKLTGANPLASFTNFVYSISAPLANPFYSVFPRTVVEGSVFEWTTLLAMLVYLIVGLGIVQLFVMGRTVSTPEAAAKLEREETI